MEQIPDTHSFPGEDDSARGHSIPDDADKKEKYLREAGKIEDLPNNEDLEKMNHPHDMRNAANLVGEEKNEDDLSTGESAKDLNQRKKSL